MWVKLVWVSQLPGCLAARSRFLSLSLFLQVAERIDGIARYLREKPITLAQLLEASKGEGDGEAPGPGFIACPATLLDIRQPAGSNGGAGATAVLRPCVQATPAWRGRRAPLPACLSTAGVPACPVALQSSWPG